MSARLAIYTVSNLFSGVASLLSVLVLSRLLSAEGFGQYATVMALAAVGQTAGFTWLQSSIIRLHPAESDASGRSQFAGAMRWGFVLSAIAVSVPWVIGLVVLEARSIHRMLLGVAGLSIVLSGAGAGVGLAWNRVTERPWRFVVAQAMQSLGGLALATIGLAWRPRDPLVAIAGLSVGSVFAAMVSRPPIIGAFKDFHQLRPRVRQCVAYGGPVAAVALGYSVLRASDRLLIASILGPAAVGAYAAASGIAGRALGLLLPPIATAIKPQVFIEFSQRGAEPARQLLDRMSGWLIVVGLPVTLLFLCVPRTLASTILGGEMAGAAAEVLPWTAVGALLSAFLTLHFASAFQIARRTTWMLVAVAPAAVSNIAFNWLLLPKFGVVAAGWSMVASYTIALVLAIGFGRRHFRVPFSLADASRTSIACLPLVAFLQLEFPRTRAGFVLLLGGSALVYLASALSLNVAQSRSLLVRWVRESTAARARAGGD